MAKHSIVNVLGCGLVILLLSNCSSAPIKEVKITTRSIDKPNLILPKVDKVEMRDIEWFAITPKNFEEQFKKIKKSGRPLVVFALTDEGYEKLSLNFGDIRALVQQQKTIIAAYEKYYKAAETSIDEANKELKEVEKKSKNLNKTNKSTSGFFQKINPFK